MKQKCCYSYDWESEDIAYGALITGPPYGGHVIDSVSSALLT
mgnify:FL=1